MKHNQIVLSEADTVFYNDEQILIVPNLCHACMKTP